MRVLKFRCWDNNEKKMITQEHSDRVDKVLAYYETHIKTTIMQYICLEDIEGKEIYEGDICSYKGRMGEVKYVEPYASFRVVFEGDIWAEPDRCKVEGNIYEL